MKRTLTFVALAVVTFGLTACSSDGSSSQSAPAGEAIKCELSQASAAHKVQITGDRGMPAQVKTELADGELQDIQLLNVDKGSGSPVVSNPDVVYRMHITLVDSQGVTIASQPIEASLDPKTGGLVPWISQAAGCVSDKGRVSVAGPANKLLPSATRHGEERFKPESPVVAVIDFQGTVKKLAAKDILPSAQGKEMALPEGFPEVTFDKEKGPQIKIPEGLQAPSELKIATQIEGNGEVVKDGANVYVHYRGVIWRTGKEFDASWTRGAHTAFKTNQVIPGFTKALVGQKVGSRVVALVDPANGYGQQLEAMGHKADDVMVFVVDILGVENVTN